VPRGRLDPARPREGAPHRRAAHRLRGGRARHRGGPGPLGPRRALPGGGPTSRLRGPARPRRALGGQRQRGRRAGARGGDPPRHVPGDGPRARPFFIGGGPEDDATRHRIEGFRAAVEARGGTLPPEQVLAGGYAPLRARAEVTRLHGRLGGLPAALFVNSLTVFEGVLAHLATLPPEDVEGTALGVYDYDPMAALLRFPVHMVRQNSAELVARLRARRRGRDRAPPAARAPRPRAARHRGVEPVLRPRLSGAARLRGPPPGNGACAARPP
jgi:hypothetical protein